MDSNDSTEIPDRGETSDIPCFPSGAAWEREDLEYQFWLPGYNAKVTEASKDKLCVVVRCMNRLMHVQNAFDKFGVHCREISF